MECTWRRSLNRRHLVPVMLITITRDNDVAINNDRHEKKSLLRLEFGALAGAVPRLFGNIILPLLYQPLSGGRCGKPFEDIASKITRRTE